MATLEQQENVIAVDEEKIQGKASSPAAGKRKSGENLDSPAKKAKLTPGRETAAEVIQPVEESKDEGKENDPKSPPTEEVEEKEEESNDKAAGEEPPKKSDEIKKDETSNDNDAVTAAGDESEVVDVVKDSAAEADDVGVVPVPPSD